MTSHEPGPLPYKPERKSRDPMIEAIARNPRPLIMVLIGLIGMPLTLWLSSPQAGPEQPAREVIIAPEEAARLQVERDTVVQPLEPAPVTVQAEPLPPEPSSATPVVETPVIEEDSFTGPLVQEFHDNEAPLFVDPDPAIAPVRETDTRYISIIIDDIGYVDSLGARAVALPDDVTFAVLPHTPFGTELAEAAHSNGKEIMLHAPMSNLANMPLGPGALTPSLSKEEFVSTLTLAIEAIPHLQGINNHMGSELTAQEHQMQWVMETLKGRNLYFVDSYTTAKSVAGRIAREQEIPTLTRNVFLDNVQTYEEIDREFQRLLQFAREHGSAVGIGHPYEATLEYLEKAIPTLAALNIELIPVSAMIMLQQGTTDAL